MEVLASIQQESSGRVFIILHSQAGYHWLNSDPGRLVQGAFEQLEHVFQDIAQVNGKSAEHWRSAFAHLYPNLFSDFRNQSINIKARISA